MMIRNVVLASAAVIALAACDDKEACTPEVAQAKATEMTTKIQELATTNPEKLQEFMAKAQEIQGQITANPEEACKAIDELLSTLE